MISVGVGYSKKEDTLTGIREASRLALSGIQNPQSEFALLFVTPHHTKAVPAAVQTLREITGAVQVAGCSGSGVLTHQEEIEDGPGIAVMTLHSDRISGHSFFFRNITDRNGIAARTIDDWTRKYKKQEEVLLLFPDAATGNDPTLLNARREGNSPACPILGGYASGKSGAGESVQFNERDQAPGSLSGLYLTGEFSCSIGISQAFHPVTGPLIVTRSDKNRIRELRGRPPAEHLSQLIQKPLFSNLSKTLERVKIGFPADPSGTELEPGEYVVCEITGVDPSDGSLLTTREIEEGRPLFFMIRDALRSGREFQECLRQIAASLASNPPRFGLYFTSSVRGISLYGSKNVEIGLIRRYFGPLPLIGFFTRNELAPINGLNVTLTGSSTLALISDSLD